MRRGPFTVEVDGRPFSVRLRGSAAAALEVTTSRGPRLLPAWTLGELLTAFDASLTTDLTSLSLEADALTRALLATSELPEPERSELAALALWWISSDAHPLARALETSSIGPRELLISSPPLRVRVRPWSFFERAQALRDAGPSVRVGRYLRAMTLASTEVLAPPARARDVLSLPVQLARPILEAVLRVNALEPAREDAARDPALARSILRVCRALGWAPTRALEAPAHEIELLLTLLDTIGETGERPPAAAPRPQPRAGLARFPDAVIIQVEDDAP